MYCAGADRSLECVHSKQCQSHKHHYDECAERVTKQMEESENGKAKEDCVEECMARSPTSIRGLLTLIE